MSVKNLLMLLKNELQEDKTANNIYKSLYNELMNDKKALDHKNAEEYEYNYLRAVIAVDTSILTDEIKTALYGKAIEDNLILELVPDNDKTILVLKYVKIRKKTKNK